MTRRYDQERWRKLYTSTPIAERRLRVSARGLAKLLLMEAGDDGKILDVDPDEDPALTIALVLSAHPDEHAQIKADLAALVRVGVVVLRSRAMWLADFDEAQLKQSPAAARMAKQRREKAEREARREKAEREARERAHVQEQLPNTAANSARTITEDRPTDRPTDRNETREPAPSEDSGALDLGKAKNESSRRLVDQHLAAALEIFGALNEARRRVIPGSTGLRPTYASLEGIASRIESGKTLDECRRVIAACEGEIAAGNPKGADFFDSISPWRPDNFERHLARSLSPNPRSRGAAAPDHFATSGVE